MPLPAHALILIEVPQELLTLPVAQQVPVVIESMHGYLDEYRGDFPFFGWGRGFRFVRRHYRLRFSTGGKLIERVAGPSHRPRTGTIIEGLNENLVAAPLDLVRRAACRDLGDRLRPSVVT